MFSFLREGVLFVITGLAGVAAAGYLPSRSPLTGAVGALIIVLPIMAAYALGFSASVRLPARSIRPLGAVLGLGGGIALLLAVRGPLGWTGAVAAVLVAALGARDGADTYWRGLMAVGFTGLVVSLVFVPIIPLGGPFIFSVSLAYLLLRHLWTVLAHDIARLLQINAAVRESGE